MIGTHLLHYRIGERLGVGGMGEVLRARDTRLERDVAIKVLPAEFAADRERVARFEREARSLAGLNHPSIATLHGFEQDGDTQFLVMELVEGEDLAERLSRGAMPLDEALPVAFQIASALEAAHEQEIVHRDLKPANVMVGSDGRVKVLDFGLAKVWGGQDTADDGLTASPTLTAPMTRAGTVLGTAAYMSPEQARGLPLDQRSDIWSLGALLWEMLTGERLFEEETLSDTVAAVLRGEIDWQRLPDGAPRRLRRLLRRCLQRDPKQRLHAAADVRLELGELVEQPGGLDETAHDPGPSPPSRRRRRWWKVAAAAVLALASGLVGIVIGSRAGSEERSVRASIPPPRDAAFQLHPYVAGSVAVSPDGTRLVYSVLERSGPVRLWIRDLDSLRPRPLEGTEGGAHPFWSPDGRFIGFSADRQLKRVEAAGGPVTSVVELEPSLFLSGAGGGHGTFTQGRDGTVLFVPRRGSPIFAATPDGAEAVPVTRLDEAAGETRHQHPRFLPDGETFLYVATIRDPAPGPTHRLMVGSVDGAPARSLMRTSSYAEVAAGFLWFVRDGVLMAQRFDVDAAELVGEPIAIGEDAVSSVWAESEAHGFFSVSESGVIAYHSGPPISRSQLTWYDRSGRQLGTVGPADYQYQLSLSNDGSRAVLQVADLEESSWPLWIYDLERGTRSRLTGGTAATGVWAPGDRRVAYQATSIHVQEIGFDEPKRLSQATVDRTDREGLGRSGTGLSWPLSWSSDGEYLVFASEIGGFDLWGVRLAEGGDPFPIQHSESIEEDAALSPDGRWLAYTSDRSGRFEVYLTAFPEGGRALQVSSEGGLRPEWGPEGELFFLDLDDRLLVTTVRPEGDFVSTSPIESLFRLELRSHVIYEPGGYAVSPDGDRILVNRVLSEGTPDPIHLVVRWSEQLRR